MDRKHSEICLPTVAAFFLSGKSHRYSLGMVEEGTKSNNCDFFLNEPGQTIQSSQSQRRMASSSTTSTAKEKDEFAGVTVEGGAGASGSSTGTSMTKSKLSDTQNEGRVNRKLVTTSLSSVGATMSSSSKCLFFLLSCC